MRMFVAVLPPADLLTRLEEFLAPRRDADPALRWTDPTQWHVTLAFLPSVPDKKLDDLLERLQRAAARRPAGSVLLAGAGAFPTPDRARVLWLGATATPTDGLARLAEGARAAAGRAGVAVEGGRFRPHLTLARLRQPVDATRWLRVLDSFEGASWPVTSYELIESHLGQGPGGRPRYSSHGTCALGAPATLDFEASKD